MQFTRNIRLGVKFQCAIVQASVSSSCVWCKLFEIRRSIFHIGNPNIGEPWCSEWQCCVPADPQANDDADFKNPLPRKKLKLTLGKWKEKVTAERRFSACSASELETACKG